MDEIVASEVDFHMERVSTKHIWFLLYDKNGGAQHVDMYAEHSALKVSIRPYEPPER
ncbi:MAG: hypothetical protein ACREFP_07445 [Acetobacteraceae bacterium]